ncbi:tudor domain-containing protein 3 [Macrosteles quadrilineatus]|uniref:tudor domain-containing protein 3 n=1 Tax=Macrosteles quadrilineatus TaxID=74068 RepID=UPI0023E12FC5|nr:tudor domain-containing protein 3 [Macrosteles quadrilineatus]
MEICDMLKEEGWHLSNDAIQRISENGTITNIRTLHNKILDLDLREISVPFFPDDIAKGKLDSVPGNVIVQVQKVRNISAPKANEDSQAAPRMLKILLTDGHTTCYGIEVEHITSLSLNTVPGTKVMLKGESLMMSHGLMLLKPSVVSVLGGRVTALIDKWELNRSLAKHTRGRIGEEGGPPPWIPFGQKILRPNLQDKNFKSLVDLGGKENAEFEAQRQGAIAEAARGGARKVFGGGTKPIVDRNVRTIMDYGYSQDQAEQALRQTRNNVDRALQNLQRRSGSGREGGKGVGGGREDGREERRGERGGRRRGDRDEEGGGGPKPSGQVSLFAFLEDKLPTSTEKEEKENENHPVSGGYSHSNNQRYNNSYQKGRSERGAKGRGHYNGPSESRNRDERSRPNNPPVQNQKPPRFQNQQQRHNESYQSWNYSDYNYDDRNNFNNRLARGYEDMSGDNYNRRAPAMPPTYEPSHDYSRGGNRRYDMHSSNGSTYKGSQARQMMEAGMPEIPEFPFKDASSLPPLLSNNTPSYFHNTPPPTIPPPPPGLGTNGETPAWVWKIGDKCMAKYWEDNMYYNAEVTGLSKKTCVVKFLEYGNFEEVLQADCIPATEEPLSHSNQHSNANSTLNSNNNHFSGILEFRRGGTRPYIKSVDSSHRKAQRNSQQMYVPPAQRKD